MFRYDFGFSVINFRYKKFPVGYTYGTHSHNHIEISYVRDGACTMGFGDDKLDFARGETMVIYPEVWHSFHTSDSKDCTLVQLEFKINNLSVLEFKEDSDDNLLFLMSLLHKTGRYLKISGSNEIHGNMDRLFSELEKPYGASSSLAKLYFFELFIHLSRQFKKEKEFYLGKTDHHVVKALQFIHNNFLEDPGVEDIAAHCGISGRYLRKLFLDQTGMQMVDYKHHLRMKLASELLKDKKLMLTEIAYRCGYSTQQYFCKVFKDYYGMSPGESRKSIDD
jgi:AraC-like DNA-binding protein